jgi:hypothetical protein
MKVSAQKKRTQAEGLALIETFYKSGLKKVPFCAQKNIPYCVLRYWLNAFKKQSSTKNQTTNFRPVKLMPVPPSVLSRNPLKVYLKPGIAIEIPVGFDAETFKQVLEVFQTCG